MSAYKIKTVTLGCRFNFYESEVAKAMVNKISPDSDVIIINTCAVTHEAERQSKQAVRKSIRENPDAKIIVTGCATKTIPDYFENLDGVFQVVQNSKKDDINAYSSLAGRLSDGCHGDEIVVIDNDDCVDPLFIGRARAFLQVQNGCDNYCSFCIVPFTRGKSTSLPIETILKHVEHFVNVGFKEIVFSGIDITSYGKDLENNIELADVLQAVLNNFPEMKRLRISSIDPNGISQKLFDLIAHEERIMPHLHLSVQSGDSDVLKMMRRRHNRDDVINLCNRLRSVRSDFIFGADFITGFPGETDNMFVNTMKIIDEAGISLLHVFPYSKRSGTLAETFIQLPGNIIKERAKLLREKGDESFEQTLKNFIGKKINFIIEKIDGECIVGKSDHFISVKIEQNSEKPYSVGDLIIGANVVSYNDNFLECVVV